MIVEKFTDGFAIRADSTLHSTQVDVWNLISSRVGLVIADPPYGNIVNEDWDRVEVTDAQFAVWMRDWTFLWSQAVEDGGAMYIWGGIGTPGFRPFFKYLPMVEQAGILQLANLITWSKKRAYGVQNNFIFTREECAYFIRGEAKKPRVFNIPLLSTKRGYAGYNKKYPAKSEFYRRTNVWTDINEIFRGKKHPTQKTQRLHEVMIETSSNLGDWVLDPFAGCGTTAFAARKLGRRFIVIENDEKIFTDMVSALRESETK